MSNVTVVTVTVVTVTGVTVTGVTVTDVTVTNVKVQYNIFSHYQREKDSGKSHKKLFESVERKPEDREQGN